MATYKEIKGTQIEAVATDPSNPVEGQVWYNTTSNALKGFKLLATGSWATVNSMNTARYAAAAASAIGTASIVFGGAVGPSSTDTVNTETWNGTNWTEVNNLNVARNQFAGFGTSTSAIAAGGNKNPGTGNETELWNGTNWTAVNTLTSARRLMPGAGVDSTAGIVAGGLGPPTYAITESWNGTNWTEVNDLNAAAGYNSNTSGLRIGGFFSPPGNLNETEEWNGTNWTEVNNLNTARGDLAGGGNTSSAIVSGGDPATAVAEQWSGTTPSTVTFTDS